MAGKGQWYGATGRFDAIGRIGEKKREGGSSDDQKEVPRLGAPSPDEGDDAKLAAACHPFAQHHPEPPQTSTTAAGSLNITQSQCLRICPISSRTQRPSTTLFDGTSSRTKSTATPKTTRTCAALFAPITPSKAKHFLNGYHRTRDEPHQRSRWRHLLSHRACDNSKPKDSNNRPWATRHKQADVVD